MESSPKEYVVRNCLTYVYDALRSKEQLMGESTTSYYENYFHQLADSLGPGKKCDVTISNSEVESFYLGQVSLGEFRLNTQRRVFSKVPGWEFAPFSSLIWSECNSAPDKATLCAKINPGTGRQIWEIFMFLDTDSQGKIHIDDICDLIQRVLRENGHVESEQNIKEWFCEEILVDFWSFFAAIVENYASLLKPNIIRTLHELITSEVLLCGKLTKKGHKIHSWKERWFTLQPTLLSYYESQENMVLKGTISIGDGSQFEFLPDSKGRQRKFRVLDSQTQVPYEICTPDVDSLQLWNNGIRIAMAMNRVSGTNFLHRLSLAQKQLFPETVFCISAITPSAVATPSANGHRSTVGSKSILLDKQVQNLKSVPPVPTPYKSKSGSQLPYQSTFPPPTSGGPDGNLDNTPPVPPQRNIDTGSAVPRPKPQGVPPDNLDIKEQKVRRRHSSIIGSLEYEREMEREMEKMNVDAEYATVNKPKKRSQPNTPDAVVSPSVPPVLPEKGVRRIRPKTPPPSAQKRGYVQLQFQNGTSNLQSPNSAPTPTESGLPKDIRTKWGYSTVVFGKDAQKEKELEVAAGTKRNKPLPLPPPVDKSTSDLNIGAPQPVPRQKKPQSLTDVRTTNGQSGLEYTDVDFSAPNTVPTQNVAGGRRELPKLPSKENSIDSPTQAKPAPRPRPSPRQKVMSPASEAPPPLPARRSPIPPMST